MTSSKWVFAGFYPFQSLELPGELSRLYGQHLFTVADNVVGLMLRYPHGFDDDPGLMFDLNVYQGREFMHIFNMGTERVDSVSGVARCVKYETGPLPPRKRITFALERGAGDPANLPDEASSRSATM
jgi:hypothetical protein